MQLELRETATFSVPKSALWALLTDLDAMTAFVGFGPIPGIAKASWVEGDGYRQGAVRLVENRDGSRHREEVAAVRDGELLEDRIFAFTSPLRVLAREARDRFELDGDASATILRRSFTLELTTPLVLPLVLALRPLLRVAIKRHHAQIRALLERRPA